MIQTVFTPGDVLRSTAWLMSRARHVRLNDAAIARWADAAPARDALDHSTPLDEITGTRDEIAHLVLLTDALNFCFWSERPISVTWNGRRLERFLAFAATLARAVREDRRWLDAAFWADMTRTRFEAILPREGTLLMIDERVAVLREAGSIVNTQWQGRFSNAAEEAGHDAARLASLLAERIGSFRDVSAHDGRPVALLKRAQICAIDLALGWSRRGMGTLGGLDQLTAFADYRVPQILRHLGIVETTPDLAERIEREEELPAGSAEEIELRAASIQAVERMRSALAARGRVETAWRIDFDLWGLSHGAGVTLKHHRTRTVFY